MHPPVLPERGDELLDAFIGGGGEFELMRPGLQGNRGFQARSG